MSQIELIGGLPDWEWKAHSAEEIRITGEDLADMSDFIWRIGNFAVLGYIYANLLSPPWMWFVLAENVSVGDLVDMRRACFRIPKGTLTSVAAGFEVGFKFARLYGFEETGEELDYEGRAYRVMRKK